VVAVVVAQLGLEQLELLSQILALKGSAADFGSLSGTANLTRSGEPSGTNGCGNESSFFVSANYASTKTNPPWHRIEDPASGETGSLHGA
jgi:hypothetical protein